MLIAERCRETKESHIGYQNCNYDNHNKPKEMSYIPSKPLSVRVVLKHEKPFTPQNKQPGVDAKSGEIGIIEQGTASGQATLVICLETVEGKNIYFEITGNQFEMLMGCYHGAKQRFAERVKMN